MTSQVFEPGFRGGGPVRSIARIVDTVSEQIGVARVTRDRDHGSPTPYEGLSGRWFKRGGADVFYLGTRSLRQWAKLLRELRRQRFDLLYVNSLWAPMFTILPILAVRAGLITADQVLIAPRGELSPGALALKGTKKRLFLRWWGAVLRDMAVVWHASTPMEAGDIRAVCPWAEVEVNGNQTALPQEPSLPDAVNTGPIRLVFLSRITAKKNLDLALCALSRVVSPFVFDIYGPVEDERYWDECRSIIRDMPPNARVTYRGEVHPDRVRETFATYDASVFPTRGENFGHVIAESLSVSCPVVCSAETPWTDLLASGGGTVVRDLSVNGLRTALQRLAAEAPLDRARRRVAAGDAFQRWRATTPEVNILDRITGGPAVAAEEPR
jgi:glycosyltransferase involved in cell wall biosynthesis